MSNFGGAVFLSNVDDFVNPSQACVNPVFNGAATTVSTNTTSPLGGGEVAAVAIRKRRGTNNAEEKRSKTDQQQEVVTATIADCLACSGCVTTAETVLMEERHNLEKLSSALESKRPVVMTISPAALADWQRHHHQCRNGGGDGDSTTDLTVTSVAQWVTLWHKYLNVVAVIDGNLPLQWSRSAAVREFVTAYRIDRLSPTATAAESTSDLDGKISKSEMFEQQLVPSRALDRNKSEYWLADGTTQVVDEEPRPRAHQSLPLITSSCPAIVCYVEKSCHALVPHLSTAASPMMCFSTSTTTASARTGVDGVFHLAIQPCHDKKLESNRLDYAGSGLDLVLTTGELLDFMNSQYPTVKDWHAVASQQAAAESTSVRDPPELAAALSSRLESNDRALYCLPTNGFLRPTTSTSQNDEPQIVGSGGYADTVFRCAAQELFGIIDARPVWEPVASTVRRGRNGRNPQRDFYSASLYRSDVDGIYETTPSSPDATLVWKFGIAYGLQTVQRIFADLDSYHYIEAMACAGSCLNGAGQLRLGNPETPSETRDRLAATRRLFGAVPQRQRGSSLDDQPVVIGASTRFHIVPAMRHSIGVAAGVAVTDTRW